MPEGPNNKEFFTYEVAMLIGELKASQVALNNALAKQNEEIQRLASKVSEISNKINKAAGGIAVLTLAFTAAIQFVIAKLKGM